MGDRRTEEIAAVTPEMITEFMHELTWNEPGLGALDWKVFVFPTAYARRLGLARRALEDMVAWAPELPRVGVMTNGIELIGIVLKDAIVDKESDRVCFCLSNEEIVALRRLSPRFVEYEVIKMADAKSGRRGRR